MAGITITWTDTTASPNYDISAQGFDDWALWNAGSGSGTNVAPAQRKSGGGSTIGNMTCAVATLDGFAVAIAQATWAGGTPTGSGANNNAIYNALNGSGGTANGADCQTTLPADTTQREAKFYIASYAGAVTLTCTLSDGSAGPATNTGLNDPGSGGTAGYYTITYSAASAGQTLTVKAVANANGPFADVEPQGIGYKVLSSGVSVNATGVEATSAVGTASPATDLAASGVQATGSVGTGVAAIDVAAAGVGATASVGDVTVATDLAAAGVQAAATAGDVVPALDLAVSGVGSTAAVGDTTAALAVDASGVSASAAVGDAAADLTVAATGVEATTAAGDVTVSTGASVSVTGVEAAASAGDVGPDLQVAVTGVGAASAVGDVAFVSNDVSVVASGVEANAAVGDVAFVSNDVTVAASGVEATAAVGDVIFVSGDVTVAVTGVSATASAGNVTPIGGSQTGVRRAWQQLQVDLLNRWERERKEREAPPQPAVVERQAKGVARPQTLTKRPKVSMAGRSVVVPQRVVTFRPPEQGAIIHSAQIQFSQVRAALAEVQKSATAAQAAVEDDEDEMLLFAALE